ncbi:MULTISPECIES: hypothetical protein [unclassified Psychrobacillus]|uniref:hypothetical protein n=1 Tax=unclassified Psychrobacillus TaxID=2636677 RepID=UPI001246670C|nr:hypothetical protein [Psychrobacillus sp. AK 1817]QEY20496.1 hypothetical protein D0S48_07170 [Psychrobacillus sp. AK 1817]
MSDLLKDTVESYNNYLVRLPIGCQEISNLLRKDLIMDAMNLITNFSEGVIWLTTANDLFLQSKLHSELNAKKIHEFLHEVNNGLEIQDYVLIADMFEYEIKPFFEECSAIEFTN